MGQNNEKRIHITAGTEDGQPLQIITREGAAEKIFYKQPYNVTGNLATLASWINNPGKKKTVDPDKAILILNEESGTALLQLDPTDELAGTVSGKTELSADYMELKVNRGARNGRFDRMELVEMLKRKRALFPDIQEHGKLLSELANLKVNVHGQIVNADNDRGNTSRQFTQSVAENNVPLNFVMKFPVFKGDIPQQFAVSICFRVEGSEISFWLESVEAHEVERKRVQVLLDEIAAAYTDHGVVVVRQ